MKQTRKNIQAGFTIIELLIATTVFSLVLVVFLTAFLQISALFYKGVSMSQTQEAARNTMQSITDDIQFYKQPPRSTDFSKYFCIGIHRYSYFLGVQVVTGSSTKAGIYREDVGSSCFPPQAPNDVNLSTADQLLNSQMQVNDLTPNCTGQICTVHLHIVYYGNDKRAFVSNKSGYNNNLNSPTYDAYKAPDAQCTGSNVSSQFCAVADFTNTVLQNF